MTPKEYVHRKRLERGYHQAFDKIDQRHLKQYLDQLPTIEDKTKAEKIWANRNNLTLSEIWDETSRVYKNHLLIGLSDLKKLKSIVSDTYIGVLPTGEVNAFASAAPNGERMVILNEGLLYTIHYWSSFYLRTLEEGNDDFFWKNIEIRENTLKWIYSIWNNKLDLIHQVPKIFPKTKDSWQLSQVLTFSSINFVLAHEFGHVLHNHKGYSADKIINHKMEIEADDIALDVAFRYSFTCGIRNFPQDNYYTKFMMAGPYLVLSILAMFGINDSQTHPSVLERIKKINSNFELFAKKYLGEEKFNVFMDYLDRDFFERLKSIGEKQLQRHLLYSKEMDHLKKNWI